MKDIDALGSALAALGQLSRPARAGAHAAASRHAVSGAGRIYPGYIRGKRAEATEATAAVGTCGSEVVLGQTEGVEHDGHIAEAVRASARGALRLLPLNHVSAKLRLNKYEYLGTK